MSDSIERFLARPPFTSGQYGCIRDQDGDRIITCHDESPPCELYKEEAVDSVPYFICPKCGRLGMRMEEATFRQTIEGLKQ